MRKIGYLLVKMLDGGIAHELAQGNNARASQMMMARAKIIVQYHLHS